MKKITIAVNGEKKEIQEGLTIEELLGLMEIKSKMLVVEKNKEIIDKKNYVIEAVKEGDSFEIVGFFGGG